jgi:hypothetical protein
MLKSNNFKGRLFNDVEEIEKAEIKRKYFIGKAEAERRAAVGTTFIETEERG